MSREVDLIIPNLQNNERLLNTFIGEHEPFVQKCHLHWQRRTFFESNLVVSDNNHFEDTWSVALSAFHEAIQTYDYERGSFFSFAALVIDRRLIDYYRKEKKFELEISVDPYVFESPSDQDMGLTERNVKNAVVRQLRVEPDPSISNEIEAANQIFSCYGFTFFDLADCSPKADKTKQACAKAVACLLNNPFLFLELENSRQLPIKKIEQISEVPRKILERHRKFIIAASEIINGDYPHLAHYLRYIREEIFK